MKPSTIVCILCKGWVSAKKGDKTRFFHHISNDHEVHHDMDLLFSLSHLQEKDKDVIAESVNAILKGDKNKNDICGDDSTVGESVYDDNDDVSLDELLKDVEEDEDDCEDEEEVQEAKEAVKKTLPKEIASHN